MSRDAATPLRVAKAVALLGIVGGCELQQLDAVRESAPDASTSDMDAFVAPDVSLDAYEATTMDAYEAAAVADEASPDGSGVEPDAPSDAVADLGSGANPDASGQACNASGAPVLSWTFDANINGWLQSSDPGAETSVSWSGAAGNTSPGTLEVDYAGAAPDATGGPLRSRVYTEMTARDLTGRTVSAWVRLDQGQSPDFFSYVQTQTNYAWADNGAIRIPAGTWTCVSFPLASPVTVQSGYDPTQVIRIGYMMEGVAPFRILIDSVRVE